MNENGMNATIQILISLIPVQVFSFEFKKPNRNIIYTLNRLNRIFHIYEGIKNMWP